MAESERASTNRLDFRNKFGTDGVVVLPVIHVRNFDEACSNIQCCINKQAPGAFLINHDFRVADFIPILKRIRQKYPRFWLGVNLLGYNGIQTFQTVGKQTELSEYNAFWCDNGLIDVRDATFMIELPAGVKRKIFIESNTSDQVEIILVGRSSRALPLRKGDIIIEINGEPAGELTEKNVQSLLDGEDRLTLKIKNHLRGDANKVLKVKADVGYEGSYFGGVAFKGQQPVSEENLGKAASVGSGLMDAVVTSGKKTGSAIDLVKLQKMRAGVGDGAPLIVASGITLDNFNEQAPFIDAVFVATGISKNFYNIDSNKLEALLKLAKTAKLDCA